ncbi:uncharacterized protein MONBRDRAFT_25986 [Monosiga brevicollis MX1]|uniref:Diacylglycerol kinase accessory domain-containing protein n=1 Tax=Monosiga brevicollis TaxID=81824 RepID=A9V117_MONBE|nr:uncharacterized protein MONBRDRAFT_25986 [Monosiga brevicollis MX1]EDQ88854.1 predicted protein [Monosiga brevicollis MX1]|eukprot:XP_001746467.1 hypothetical protein [Monosiga brevicollis MX1]
MVSSPFSENGRTSTSTVLSASSSQPASALSVAADVFAASTDEELKPADIVQTLLRYMQSLFDVIASMTEDMTKSSSFPREAISRAASARDRCARICEGLEERLQSALTEGTNIQDIRLAMSVILDGLSSLMAAHDLDVARQLSDNGGPSSSGEEMSVMNNYFGIGLDAKIAAEFDTLRNEFPHKCRSRLKNQMWYGWMGLKEVFLNTCKNLHRRIRIEADGKVLDLPRLQGVVILNIGSYMGGVDLWGTPRPGSSFRPQSFNDGLLEIVGIRGSMQMAMSKSLKLKPIKLCQAREVIITMLGMEKLPVQVDGEPWMQSPAVIRISLKGKMQMLCRDRNFEQIVRGWNAPLSKEADLITAFRSTISALRMELGSTGDLNSSARHGLKKFEERLTSFAGAVEVQDLDEPLLAREAFSPARARWLVTNSLNMMSTLHQAIADLDATAPAVQLFERARLQSLVLLKFLNEAVPTWLAEPAGTSTLQVGLQLQMTIPPFDLKG